MMAGAVRLASAQALCLAIGLGLAQTTTARHLLQAIEAAGDDDTPVAEPAATHESWETGLLITGFVAFFFLGVYLYYRTSESYYLSVYMGKAGYVVPGWSEYLHYCCACCIGPFARRDWEAKHRYFTASYPEKLANQAWQGRKAESRGKWRRLKRGDDKIVSAKATKIVNKIRARLYLELIDTAIDKAVKKYLAEAKRDKKNLKKKQHAEKLVQNCAHDSMNVRGAERKQRRQTELFQMEQEFENDPHCELKNQESSEDEDAVQEGMGAIVEDENEGGDPYEASYDQGVIAGGWGVPMDIHAVQQGTQAGSRPISRQQVKSARGSQRWVSSNPLFDGGEDGSGGGSAQVMIIPPPDFDSDSSDDQFHGRGARWNGC